MSYTIGSAVVHRELLLDCNRGKTFEPTIIGVSPNEVPLQTHFSFSLWEEMYVSKLLLKQSQIPYTFFNTFGAEQGITVRLRSTYDTLAANDPYTATQTFQVKWYQITWENFIQALLTNDQQLENAGSATPNTDPENTYVFDSDDQQFTFTVDTVGTDSAGTSDLVSLSLDLIVDFDPTRVPREKQETLIQQHFAQLCNPPQSGGVITPTYGATVDGETVDRYIVPIDFWFNSLAVGEGFSKENIMNFVVPPYIVVHSDIMLGAKVKPSVVVMSQNMGQNEKTSQMTNNQAACAMGVAFLTQSSGNSVVGRYYTSVSDGNLENYKEFNPGTPIKNFKVWFTYADGSLVYWDSIRPILQLFLID